MSRLVIGGLGFSVSLLPLAWIDGTVALLLVAVGVLAAAATVAARLPGAPTLVAAAAIGHVAERSVPTLGALGVAALLALFLAAAEAWESGLWLAGPRGVAATHAVPVLAGTAGAAAVLAIASLPSAGGWTAAIVVVLGAAAGGVVVHAGASLTRDRGDRLR